MKKLAITLFLVFGITFGYSQNNLNDYKYVIVPAKYEFLRETDKYQLNSLTKFLFNKYGFQAIMDNESFPEELASNRCLALVSDVEKQSGLLATKLVVHLKDCNNQLVFSSQVGRTKEKDYAKAYNLALRNAFKSFEDMNYEYTPNEAILAQAEAPKKEDKVAARRIEKLEQEIKALKTKKKEEIKTVAVKVVAVEEQPAKKQEKPKVIQRAPVESSNVLYAQPKGNGYQLVDSTPKVVMLLLETPKPRVFLVKGESAMVYQEGDIWYIAKENGGEVSVELLPVKF